MAKAIYQGVSGVARKVKQPNIGVSGVARKVKSGFVGVSGVARGCFTGTDPSILYNYGDECTDVTGGWQTVYGVQDNGIALNKGTATLTKNADHMYLYVGKTADIVYSTGCMVTSKKIDLTNYNKIYVEVGALTCAGTSGLPNVSSVNAYIYGGVSQTQNKYQNTSGLTNRATHAYWSIGWSPSYHSTYNNYQNSVREIPISSVTGEWYVFAVACVGNSSEGTQSQMSAVVKKVWLAK